MQQKMSLFCCTNKWYTHTLNTAGSSGLPASKRILHRLKTYRERQQGVIKGVERLLCNKRLNRLELYSFEKRQLA